MSPARPKTTKGVKMSELEKDLPPTENPTEPPKVEIKTYTQEEYDKAIQSASSKGKNEILQTLGITSVDETKTKLSEYDRLKPLEVEYATLKEKHDALEKAQAEAADNALIEKLGIETGSKDIFLQLLANEPGDESREIKAERVREKIFKIVEKDLPGVKIGAGKTPATDPTLKEQFEEMRKL